MFKTLDAGRVVTVPDSYFIVREKHVVLLLGASWGVVRWSSAIAGDFPFIRDPVRDS